MPLDPQTQALIARFAGGTPVDQMTVQEMRALSEERAQLTAGAPEPVAQISERHAPGPAGPIRIRVYTPAGGHVSPGLVYFHGGGWVRGSLDTVDVLCRALANAAGCGVASVDYRMAPEHLFPAAIDDALAATRWIAAHAAELGIDGDRLAVGGDSAGGNIAAVVALLLRDAGGPKLAHQLLIYPVTDCNFETDSYRTNAEGYMLTRGAMEFYWRTYLRDPSDAADFRASPLRAPHFGGLPSATVMTAEYDPLRDEGRAYADKLREAGVQVEYRDYAGLIHGFATNTGVLDRAADAVREAASALRAAFEVPSSALVS